MDITSQQNIPTAVIGGSRGLGRALARELNHRDPKNKPLIVARNKPKEDFSGEFLSSDLSKRDNWPKIWESLGEFNIQRIFFCAGGGPYGRFADRKFEAHLWALNVSFLSAAFLIHQSIKAELSQFIVVGSDVAESKPDPNASSYCASKHALLGLVASINQEYSDFDLRIFSPTYLDTDMLPPNSPPRLEGIAEDPKIVAQDLLNWALDPGGIWHYKWNPNS